MPIVPSSSSKTPAMIQVVLDRTLHEAIVRRDLTAMRDALHRGADCYAEKDGVPVWFYCTQMQTPGMLGVFLDAGIDPNVARTDTLHRGMTFLQTVAYQGSLAEFEQALAQGGDPRRRAADGQGVVDRATFGGHPELLRRAIGLAPEQVNPVRPASRPGHPVRYTPLQAAALGTGAQAADLVQVLLDAGADPSVSTGKGDESVLDLARANGCLETLAVLERHALRATLTDLDQAASAPRAPTVRERPRL